jgi:hypothetical protein
LLITYELLLIILPIIINNIITYKGDNMFIEELASFSVGKDPYIADMFHMGISVDNNIEIMYGKHTDNKYIIIVDKRTGNRLKIIFTD